MKQGFNSPKPGKKDGRVSGAALWATIEACFKQGGFLQVRNKQSHCCAVKRTRIGENWRIEAVRTLVQAVTASYLPHHCTSHHRRTFKNRSCICRTLTFRKLADFEHRAKWSRSESQGRHFFWRRGVTWHQRKGEKASFRSACDECSFGLERPVILSQLGLNQLGKQVQMATY